MVTEEARAYGLCFFAFGGIENKYATMLAYVVHNLAYIKHKLYLCCMATRYVTPYKYAKLCGVSSQAIYLRISRNVLDTIKIAGPDGEEKTYIDTEKNPPERWKK